MKIVADLNKCQGHGLCVVTAPDVFDQGEDGLVQLK
ncbi:MAG: ferredoxin, partial [Propionibacterium sp.]|nr:ferredoxin [Propionibacterium sp.]